MGKLGGILKHVGSNFASDGRGDLLIGRIRRSLLKFLVGRRRKLASAIPEDVTQLHLRFMPPKAAPLMQPAVIGHRRLFRSSASHRS